MDLANRNTDATHFDEITEDANLTEVEQFLIDSRIEGMWQQKDTICRIIVENIDDIHSAIDWEPNEAEAVEKIITDAMRTEVEDDLNL